MTFDFLRTTIPLLLAFVLQADAQTLDQRVEQFISEAEPRYMIGVQSTDDSADMGIARSVTRKISLLPDEALDSALRLLASERQEGGTTWRVRVVAFLHGMYRTHVISESKHRLVAQAVFNETISPTERAFALGEFYIGIDFLQKWGTKDDMLRLSPLLRHSDPEVRRLTTMCLGRMAYERGLPDPTVTGNKPDAKAPIENTFSEPEASRGEHASTPPPPPKPTPEIALQRPQPDTRVFAIGIASAFCLLVLAWLLKRRFQQ